MNTHGPDRRFGSIGCDPSGPSFSARFGFGSSHKQMMRDERKRTHACLSLLFLVQGERAAAVLTGVPSIGPATGSGRGAASSRSGRIFK
jgi:hypothetical protein